MSTMVMAHGIHGPVRGRAGSARASQALRLTRRGRLVVTTGLTGAALTGFVLAGGASVASLDAGRPTPVTTIEVEQGQTLWSIADDVAAPGSTREMVYRIQRLNALPDATLSEGQLLAVPVD